MYNQIINQNTKRGVKMLQEDRKNLREETLDLRRAIDSLREEMEAIDHYHQRADACSDINLKKILMHNANEEKEHAAMLIEWIRQHDKVFAENVDEYTKLDDADIAGKEELKDY